MTDSVPAETPVTLEIVDPVSESMSVEGITRLCDEHLENAKSILDEIRGLKNAPDEAITYAATAGRVDDLWFEVGMAGGFTGLMALAHPDETVKSAAQDCRPKLDRFATDAMLDETFAGVIFRYEKKGEALEGTRARMLRELVRDFRRNGLDLPTEKQKRLRELNEELTQLEQDFEKNLSDAVLELEVTPEQLKGTPESFQEQHPPGDNGKVTLTTNYPDYFPIVTYAEDRTVARELARKFNNRAAGENVKILERVLDLRYEKAQLLGYETWAHYAVEPRMAKTPAAVRKFLDDAAERVKKPAQREYAEFMEEHVRRGGDAKKPIPQYDRPFLGEILQKKKYGFDSKKLSEYFEVETVLTGLLTIVEKLYGLKFRPASEAPKWHEDVRVLDVLEDGEERGRIYLDLFPRDGKYKHAAMFDLRSGKQLADGRYVPPIAALVTNFPKPGKTPALLTHDQVTTLFHEFGHTLHHVVTEQPLSSYSGTSTVRDFVEAPSQMFEEWTWKRETLDLFAKHHESGERIPDDLFQAMTRARSFGRALSTERQLSLSRLDFQYHSLKPPFDTDQVFDDVMKKSQSFSYLADTHFQATFGHLMGYDAAYYGYQWALAIARDVLTRFDAEGYLNEKVADDWREQVLSRGGGPDESQLVEAFLGRSWNLDAYSKFLRGE